MGTFNGRRYFRNLKEVALGLKKERLMETVLFYGKIAVSDFIRSLFLLDSMDRDGKTEWI